MMVGTPGSPCRSLSNSSACIHGQLRASVLIFCVVIVKLSVRIARNLREECGGQSCSTFPVVTIANILKAPARLDENLEICSAANRKPEERVCYLFMMLADYQLTCDCCVSFSKRLDSWSLSLTNGVVSLYCFCAFSVALSDAVSMKVSTQTAPRPCSAVRTASAVEPPTACGRESPQILGAGAGRRRAPRSCRGTCGPRARGPQRPALLRTRRTRRMRGSRPTCSCSVRKKKWVVENRPTMSDNQDPQVRN